MTTAHTADATATLRAPRAAPLHAAPLRAATSRGARLGPAAQAVALVYATCLLLALAYPQAVAAWLDDFEPNPVVEVAQGCVSRLVAVSQRLGLAGASGSVREAGQRLTRKPN